MNAVGPLDEVARDLGWPLDSVTATPLGASDAPTTWRADVEGVGRFAVRLREPIDVEVDGERLAIGLAAQHRVGPVLVFARDDGRALVTEFAEGRHPAPGDLQRAHLLRWVVEIVRRFHGVGPLLTARDPLAVETALPAAVRDRIRAALGIAPPAAVACHCDLRLSNIVVDDRAVALVGYARAAMADPFADLATLSVNAALDDDGDYTLIDTYFDGEVTPARWARLKLFRLAVATAPDEPEGDRFEEWLKAAEEPVE